MPSVPIASIPFIMDGFLTTLLPGVPIAYQGVTFDPPDIDLWVRPVCKTGDMEDAEKGCDGYSRRNGLYIVDIFAPAPKKTKDAWEKAVAIECGFRRQCVNGVQIEDPYTENLGIDPYNKFHVRVIAPWWCWAA